MKSPYDSLLVCNTDPRLPAEARDRWFFVRFVRKGDRYGRNDCLTHEDERPMVEFYDYAQDKHAFGPRGQFVSRYYVETIMESEADYLRGETGLNLDAGIAAWSVDGAAMREVAEHLRERMG